MIRSLGAAVPSRPGFQGEFALWRQTWLEPRALGDKRLYHTLDIDQGEEGGGRIYSLPSFMSFSCPHFRPDDEHCLRLGTDCVPGRRGCVLPKSTVFAVPAEVRVQQKEAEKRAKMLERLAKGEL